MIKMQRGEFYLLIWMLVTGTGSFFEVDMQALSAVSILLAVGLYAHSKHIEKEENRKRQEKRKEEYELKKHMDTIKKMSIVLGILFLSACSSTNLQQYSPIDYDDKSITVPAGARGLKGYVKSALKKAGWRFAVRRGPSVIESNGNKMEEFDTYNTRYTLVMGSYIYDYCFDFTPKIEYDISVIDNETGSEVITMNGRGCENEVADKLVKALN